jgi:hypothetical protein
MLEYMYTMATLVCSGCYIHTHDKHTTSFGRHGDTEVTGKREGGAWELDEEESPRPNSDSAKIGEQKGGSRGATLLFNFEIEGVACHIPHSKIEGPLLPTTVLCRTDVDPPKVIHDIVRSR